MRAQQEREERDAPSSDVVVSQNRIEPRKTIKIGRPGYKVVKQMDPETKQRSLLFQIDYPEIEEGLQPRTAKTITTLDALLEDFRSVRERGYSIDDEENEIGVRCVGAPIRDSRGQVFASVSVSGPTERMPLARVSGLASTVMQTADQISRELGWNGRR